MTMFSFSVTSISPITLNINFIRTAGPGQTLLGSINTDDANENELKTISIDLCVVR